MPARILFTAALAAGILAGCRAEDGEHPRPISRDTAGSDRHIGRDRLPGFEQYAVPRREVFGEAPSRPDLETAPWARGHAEIIRDGMKRGSNFAGHYVVVSWECGASCRQSAIVDAITGRIYPGPQASHGYRFRIDSRLLIVDPPESLPSEGIRGEQGLPQAWLWRTGRIEQLR